jgi:saccharopine dehydrogenase-like NADP-dependent oxidoreductase
MSQVKNIAIVGASGQQGSPIVKALITSGKFVLTAVTRSESSSTFPSDVKVARGDYSDEFFESAFKGQDVLIIILGVTAPKDLQSRMIKAAAAASVPWVLPCEFGPDGESRQLMEGIPFLGSKKKERDEIEALGKSAWIGIVCGLWFDVVCRHSLYVLLVISTDTF